MKLQLPQLHAQNVKMDGIYQVLLMVLIIVHLMLLTTTVKQPQTLLLLVWYASQGGCSVMENVKFHLILQQILIIVFLVLKTDVLNVIILDIMFQVMDNVHPELYQKIVSHGKFQPIYA